MLRYLAIGVAVAVACGGSPALAGPLTSQQFASAAAQAGLAEVELGKIATENAHSAEVKKFAATMVAEHSKTNEELAAIAKVDDITLPTQPTFDQKVVADKLRSLSGESFDRAFAAQMVADHREALQLFTNASGDQSLDPELRQFAEKTLVTLKQHQDDARRLNEQVSSAEVGLGIAD